ncbi:uncharacterized protein LOC125038840 [Penaeus chinensis]|uniref:uncharacterized protein LOC125038840 n=1 Tax=Penaeus chinensis TaxID=139456 RepID=UPI001FB85375|nr:uncharacterized protein LOC125038840 [Penaeus chinensis]
MKYLAVLLLAALAGASPVEKREADADPSVPIYGHPGYGYSRPIFYRGYGYQSPYGRSYRHDLHKRAADPEAEANPSYIPPAHALYRPSSVGPKYAHPYRPVHPVHKRSADPEPESSHPFPIYSPYHSYHSTTYGYPHIPVHPVH